MSRYFPPSIVRIVRKYKTLLEELSRIKGGQIFILGNIGKSSGRVKRFAKNKDLTPLLQTHELKEELTASSDVFDPQKGYSGPKKE